MPRSPGRIGHIAQQQTQDCLSSAATAAPADAYPGPARVSRRQRTDDPSAAQHALLARSEELEPFHRGRSIVAVGQDGLVANVAKYLAGQVVIGIDPEPERNPGVLVPHRPDAIASLLARAVADDVGAHVQPRVMVEAIVDDGQHLRALNEVFVGHPSHQSARYRIVAPDDRTERHSSSGVLVGTGTGSTGWCRSAWLERHSTIALPIYDEPRLCWFVREAWPSPATGTDCTEGLVAVGQELVLIAESDLVIFGDGIESDALSLTWGQQVAVRLADQRLHLLV